MPLRIHQDEAMGTRHLRSLIGLQSEPRSRLASFHRSAQRYDFGPIRRFKEEDTNLLVHALQCPKQFFGNHRANCIVTFRLGSREHSDIENDVPLPEAIQAKIHHIVQKQNSPHATRGPKAQIDGLVVNEHTFELPVVIRDSS